MARRPQEILDLPSDFVTRIVGTELVRVRSQTVYYVLTRIKSICKVWMDRQRMAQSRSTALPGCGSGRHLACRRIAPHAGATLCTARSSSTVHVMRLISFTIPAGADAAE